MPIFRQLAGQPPFSRRNSAGVKPLVSESGLFFRVPITNDVQTYFIDQKYDGRDAEV